jgi:asparagine synthase (glutamine-hydrolysing)
MCAIAGLLSSTPLDLGKLFAMTEVQAHRGPDGSGHLFIAGNRMSEVVESHDQLGTQFGLAQLALGHRRLAILDRSPAGRQPMSYANGRFWISYNGELYNYLELRSELSRLGCAFLTNSDTEVVLAAFATWGHQCFSRFNGMWGMAIWDQAQRELTLARDRFGEKPVYYSYSQSALVFASEIKALFASGLVRCELNAQVAADYFRHEIVNHSEASFFARIEALPAASFAVVSMNDPTRVVAQRYWQLEATQSQLNFGDATQQFRDIFSSAVKLRMRSDVPVGSCLSGGLDSSAIVCQMSKFGSSAPINTFTSGSSDARFDETPWAKIVADALQTSAHYETPCQVSLMNDLDHLLWHQEEPFSSVGVYAQWRIMRCAREVGIPVLLDGQGADEALMGYKKFYWWYLRSLLAQGDWLKAANETAALAIRGDRGLLRWREGARYLPASLRPTGTALSDFLLNDCAPTPQHFHKQGAGVSLQQRQLDDLVQFSLPGLLRYEDRNSMAWSVEARVPFLDHRLVEFLLGLPVNFKLRLGQTKAILRHAFAESLPSSIVNRRDKMGFATSQSVWMQGALGKRMLAELHESRLTASILDVRQLSKQWNTTSDSGRAALQASLFRAGIFAAWTRRYSVHQSA